MFTHRQAYRAEQARQPVELATSFLIFLQNYIMFKKIIIRDYHFVIIIAFLQHENSAVFNFKTKIMLQVGKNKSYSIRGLYMNRSHV